MKLAKTLLLILLISGQASFSFSSNKKVFAKFAYGIVTRISLLGSNRRHKEIVVKNSKGEEFNVRITDETAIRGVSWKPATTNRINAQDRVKIHYIVSNTGVNEATSITLKKF